MSSTMRFLEKAAITSAVATSATTLAVAGFGLAEQGNAVAPLNAVSHIPFGDEAAAQDDVSLKYTATGLGLNALAIGSWGAVHELMFGSAADKGDVATALIGGVVVSTLAYVVDYHVVPERVTPGFEKRLSGKALLGVYAALALGLGVGSLMRPRS